MRYTNEIFQRLSRGQFICANSIDADTRAVYNDLDEHIDDYADFFTQIDFQLQAGDGYFYFSRKEAKIVVENKLMGLSEWIDYLAFLKSFDTSFGAGTQFNLAQLEVQLSGNMEQKDNLDALFTDKSSNREKLETLVKALTDMGFAEELNKVEGMYQVTTAFRYIEHFMDLININEEVNDEISE
jgi:hypothetical protein